MWSLLAAATTSWGGGFLAWAALFENDASPSYPSVADALWIPFFVVVLIALALLLRAERLRVRPPRGSTR